MEFDKWYPTGELQRFLDTNQTATLSRLKKLVKKGYLSIKTVDKVYMWMKLKNKEDKQIIEGYKFYA